MGGPWESWKGSTYYYCIQPHLQDSAAPFQSLHKRPKPCQEGPLGHPPRGGFIRGAAFRVGPPSSGRPQNLLNAVDEEAGRRKGLSRAKLGQEAGQRLGHTGRGACS